MFRVWRRDVRYLLCIVFGLVFYTPAYPLEHVVLISIDGWRPETVNKETTPNIQRLLKKSAYTLKAKATRPSFTMPNHASMLTGLNSKRHGVTWNHERLDTYDGETLFTIIKNKGKTTAAFVAKTKLGFLVNQADFTYIEPAPIAEELLAAESARNIAKAVVKHWATTFPAFTFIHIREPDSVGHRYKWMSDEYLEAVAHVDNAIGNIISAIETSEQANTTAIIITTDHGGSGNNHGMDVPENRLIPWIVVLPDVRQPVVIQATVKTYDTMPTVLALMEIHFDGNIQRRVPGEVTEFLQ